MILDCQNCNASVGADYITSYLADDNEPGVPLEYQYTFLKCPECAGPFLTLQARDSRYSGEPWEDPVPLYPTKREADPHLPNRVREPFQEALTCLRNKTYTAAAIMCRKTLEATCIQHDVRSGGLKAKLSALRAADVIDRRLYEWSDALRISGNEAAHKVDVTVGRQEAKDLVDFTHALLEYIFTFRDKFDAFMQRRRRSAESELSGNEKRDAEASPA